jgi:hypothetical protein
LLKRFAGIAGSVTSEEGRRETSPPLEVKG